MKRRSRAGGKPAKARSRKALKRKGRSAPKALSHRGAAPAREMEVERVTRELNEAFEQQTATGDILKVISRSSFNLQAVLDALVKLAARLCEAELVAIHHYRDGVMQFGARFGLPQEWEEIARRNPIVPGRGTVTGRVLLVGKTVQISDVKADPEYTFTEGQKAGQFRTVLGVPLEREGQIIGVIVLARTKVLPFADRQIELVQNFAAQAVIAIENARLLSELRQSLEQQTATAEVLRVISSSPSELDPVFRIMLTSATRLCEATFGQLLLHQGDGHFINVAMHNATPAFVELRKQEPVVRASGTLALAVTDKQLQFLHIPDCTEHAFYKRGDADFVKFVDLCEAPTLLQVPLRRDQELIGVIGIYRKEVRPFADKQIALLTSFAAQAVIAIENARLLNELRQRTTDLTERTADLTESLEQQTATSEVLQVISSSPGDLQPVFDAMLAKAARICDASFGNIFRTERDALQLVGTYNTPPAFAEVRRRSLVRPDPDGPFGQMLVKKVVAHITDLAAEEVYKERRHPGAVAAVELGGVRTVLLVPMVKEDELVGVFSLYRQEVRPFSDKQVELVKNFAAQAVIAIENARLLSELRERTEEVEKLNEHLQQRVTDQVGEIERMSKLRRFLPPQVADLIVASGTEKQLESHRREITALFCDLRGFTGFSEAADPEDVMALLRDYHAAIGEIIIRYSGTLERYAGDGVMVVFNDPIPVENPALQAVEMALEMRVAIGTLTEKWRQLGHEIGFGIGIAHGYATLGTIGFEGRFDYAAIGTVSNVASRPCDEAKPGQILISPRVLMAVRDAVTVEAAGEFELRGIRRPIAAYNVLSAASPSP
jgi:GAF domain-containing protein